MDYKLLGQRIRAARLAAGLSQEQLAEMVGLTSQHISHTEVASTKISLPALVKILSPICWATYRRSFPTVTPMRCTLCWKPPMLSKSLSGYES